MLRGMHFAREDCNSGLMIRACDVGQVSIGSQNYRRSLILTAERIVPDWRPQQVTDITEQDFDTILSLQAEIIVLGTGTRLCFPSAQLTAYVLATGTGLEVMDTSAACRTYNILLSENRRVVAALLLN
ncbi:MAG: Mth938-like domain-containing protein [Gammaproteobacteria bacterium]|nr:MAG: Mth938-like domain-containing protein [Gammaproteobacteria bacterium]